jgi:hypothetical protein
MSCRPVSVILFSVWLPQTSICFSCFLKLQKFTKKEFFRNIKHEIMLVATTDTFFFGGGEDLGSAEYHSIVGLYEPSAEKK